MAKRAAVAQPPIREEEHERLVTSVDRLASEVRLLRQVMDEIREDFSWVTRNGPPVQSIEHVHVKRMALDPCADDWGEHLEIERTTYDPGSLRSKSPTAPVERETADDLKTAFETIAQGQLEVIIAALDSVRTDVLTALKQSGGQAKPATLPPMPPSQQEPQTPPSPGKLF